MSFAVARYRHPQVQGDFDPTIVVLEENSGHRIEVWPAFGFNAFRWVVPGPEAGPLELLYADPMMFSDNRPSRSGVPVLFPFPNRIAAGRFDWQGKTWTLPVNDPAGKNAIHGFACRSPWEVIDEGADAHSAWVTGRHGSRNPQGEWWCAPWPADYELTLTVRLAVDVLRLEAEVQAAGSTALPFGLGYHPYFTIPFTPGMDPADCLVEAPASASWELNETIPTGKVWPVEAGSDLNQPRRFGDLRLDDLLTSLPPGPEEAGLFRRGQIQGGPNLVLQVLADAGFRELVAFTPPHRQAVCLEPYTCPTDAVHLAEQGIACGWQILAPGKTQKFVVEFRLCRDTTLQSNGTNEVPS